MDQPIEIEPSGTARSTVIWLHGLGADGHDFEPIAQALNLPETIGTRFVFPHAPRRPVTINGGFVMRAWYDIFEVGPNARQDEAGIRDSERILGELIQRENERGIPCSQIVLAGFSQGGAIVLQTGLRFSQKLAGMMVLSSYLPLRDQAEKEHQDTNLETSIFMAHGSHDAMVPPSYGELSANKLRDMGYPVEWHTYPMGHEVHPEEILHIRQWLLRVLQP